MTARQIVQQMICSHARIDAHRVRKGTVTEEEKARMVEAAMGFSSAPLRLNDAPTLSISELVAEARLQYKQAPFEVLAVDYLQLLSGPKSENRTQEVGAVTRGLKGLARQLNIPVIVTSPLRRNERADHRPILSDLRESGDIEHTADGVVFIHREGYYGLTENDTDALLIVAKNRFGPLMDVQVTWRKEFTRFDNPDFRHGEDQPY
jgi:replicative DNA helicase